MEESFASTYNITGTHHEGILQELLRYSQPRRNYGPTTQKQGRKVGDEQKNDDKQRENGIKKNQLEGQINDQILKIDIGGNAATWMHFHGRLIQLNETSHADN